MKTVKDKQLENSTPLYVIAEMSILMIREYCIQLNWTLQTYPGKFPIPREFFAKMDDDKISENLKTVYYKDGEKREKFKMKKSTLGSTAKRNHQSSVSDDSESDSDVTQVDSQPSKKSKAEEPTRRSQRTRRTVSQVSSESLGSDE